MPTFSKHVLAAAILVALGCGSSVGTQTALSWEQVTDNLLTEDGVNLSDELPADLRNLRFLDATTGLISTHEGDVIRTGDGGATWNTIYNDAGQDLRHFLGDYYFVDSNTWFTFPSQVGTMWGRTFDAGKHWETLKNPTCPYVSPFFLNADLGWGVSDSSICATKDGGKTWAVVQPLNAAGGSGPIFMLDNTHGWVGWGRQILATSDGSHWSAQYQDPSMSILEIHFFNTNDGYAKIGSTGHGSTIIYSKDGGQHWDRTDWNVPGVAGLPGALVTCVAQRKQDVWTAAYFVRTDSARKRGPLAQYDFILFHSRNGGASFENAGKLPDNIGSPKAIAATTQQGKSVLLILDSKGALWRTFLP